MSIKGNRKMQLLAKKLGVSVKTPTAWNGHGFVVSDRLVSDEDFAKLSELLAEKEQEEKEKAKKTEAIRQKRLANENERIKEYIRGHFHISEDDLEKFTSFNKVGSGKVLRKKIPFEEKVELGLVAFFRHTKTNYEKELKEALDEIYSKYLDLDPWEKDFRGMREQQEQAHIEIRAKFNEEALAILESCRK